MIEKKVHFFSDGLKLTGTLYLPEDMKEGEKRPAIIPNSGYQGFDEFYPKMFAKVLTAAGYICLGFDYRGFAKSEGTKGRVILDEQVQDIYNAVSFLEAQDEVDHTKIGLIGWGMGASNVVRLASRDKRIGCVAGLNGFYNGERWLKSIHTYSDFIKLVTEVKEDRINRAVEGHSRKEDPFYHYPLDPATANYVKAELEAIDGFGHMTELHFTESILTMNAEEDVSDLTTPLFVGHGIDNLLHPSEESYSLFEQANEPKELYLIDGQHNDFMFSSNSEFQKLSEQLIKFFNHYLVVTHSGHIATKSQS